MKHLKFKPVLYALLFAVSAGLISAGALADPVKPVEKISWNMPDSGGDTSGDGGIRNPGPGH